MDVATHLNHLHEDFIILGIHRGHDVPIHFHIHLDSLGIHANIDDVVGIGMRDSVDGHCCVP